MAIPEEDLGPAWIRDYRNSGIEADIQRMEDFAAKLDAEIRNHYIPHLSLISDDVTIELPPVAEAFWELWAFLDVHQQALQQSTSNVTTYRDATGGFVVAAKEISKRYRDTDAFTAARAADVEAALDKTWAQRAPEPGTIVPPSVEIPLPPMHTAVPGEA